MLDRTRISDIAGSERLRMFAYRKLLETGLAPRFATVQMKQNLVSQGFYYEPGARHVIATQAWAAPVLSYDGNINGGVLQDRLTFNGFVFDADPSLRAKAEVAVGFSARGVTRLAWAIGRYIEGRLRGEMVWSPEHHIVRSTADLSLCSRIHVTGWTFLDMCHSASVVQRELGSSTVQETAFAVTQLFQTGAGYHEMTAEVAQTRYAIGRHPCLGCCLGQGRNEAVADQSCANPWGDGLGQSDCRRSAMAVGDTRCRDWGVAPTCRWRRLSEHGAHGHSNWPQPVLSAAPRLDRATGLHGEPVEHRFL